MGELFGRLPVGNRCGERGVRGDFETRATEGGALRFAIEDRVRWMLSWRKAAGGERPAGVTMEGEPSLATSGVPFRFTATDGTRGTVTVTADSNGTYRIGWITIEVDAAV